MSAPAPAAIPLSRPLLGEEERRAVLEVLDSGMIVEGPRVADFEREFATRTGTAHAVAVSSGTAALHLALLAHGIGPGDEVVTSAFSFIATANTILMTGATPVFADVDPDTFNLDPAAVERAVTARTKAVMPVHIFGQVADMDAIGEVARRHGLVVVEDAAQAVGATFEGRQAGTFGTGCFSLYATKNVMSAEGGMVTTADAEIADRVRLLRNHGMRARYQYECLGYNLRMTDLHAAIGRVQLRRLDEWTRARQRNAAHLAAGIRSLPTPVVDPRCEHVYHQFTIRVPENRAAAMERLQAAGIGCGIFYATALHQVPHIAAATPAAPLPVTERLVGEVLSLPVHPALGEADLDRIVAEVNRL